MNGRPIKGRDEMLAGLEALVTCESPSSDDEATTRCLDVVAQIATDWLGEKPEQIQAEGRRHDVYRFGDPSSPAKVVLLAHADTVWPLGTLAELPFAVDGDVVRGPGVFDMKAGLVQGLSALSAIDDRSGVVLLVTTDEEIGSPTSRALIESTALGARAALVLEPSQHGALKTERKGVSMYDVRVTGRAAHAGLEPERGVNALVELAHLVLRVADMARPELGTTVTPTVAVAGTTRNSVPESATVGLDVRATTVAEQTRAHEALLALEPILADAGLHFGGGPNRPPLERTASAGLFGRATLIQKRLGLPILEECFVGGGSDGNFTAGIGVPTLDGLGAVGDGAHARHEHALISAMTERAELVHGLIVELIATP